jgi:hypothetical protein
MSVKGSTHGDATHTGWAGAFGTGAVGGGATLVGGSVATTAVLVVDGAVDPSTNVYTPDSTPTGSTPGSRIPATATTVFFEIATPPATPPLSACDQSTAPELASRARNVKSVVLPAKATPFAIVLAAIWVHTGRLDVIALVGARELVLVPLTVVYLARRTPHPPLRADVFGKVATVAQFIALCVMAVAPAFALPAAVVTAALGLVAAGHYVTAAVRDAHARRIGRAGRDTPRA